MNQMDLDKKAKRREQVKMAQRRHMAKKKAMLEKVPETNDDETESEEENMIEMSPKKPVMKTASRIEEEHGTDASPNMDEPVKDKELHNLVKKVHMDLKLLRSEFSDLMKKLQDPMSDDTDDEPEQFPEPPKKQSAPKSMAVFV